MQAYLQSLALHLFTQMFIQDASETFKQYVWTTESDAPLS